MRAEFFQVVEMLDDWLAARPASGEARAAAEGAALDALRAGASLEDAFRAGVEAYRAASGDAEA